MARTSIAVASASKNSSAATTPTVMAGATGASGYAVDFGGADERLVITLSKDDGATGVIDFLAGDYDAAGQGNLSVIVSDGGSYVVGPLEGARFRNQSTGDLYIDCGVTGTITAVKLP